MAAFMLRRSFASLLWGVLFMWTSVSPGAELGFEFSGTVNIVVGTPFGRTIPALSPLSGHFVYETNTISSHTISGCDCTGYFQKHINGYATSFTGLTAQADEYIIQIRNNVNVVGFGMGDVVTVLYPGSSGPPVGSPLLIDGSPVEKGLMRLELVAPADTFSDSSLPASIDPNVFVLSAGTSSFGDEMPNPTPDILFKLNSLSSVEHYTSDHDLDDDVDGRDFLIWQRYFGMATGNGDANSDLMVDAQDLEIWQAQYGSGAEASAAIAVPEPASLALLVGCSLICLARR